MSLTLAFDTSSDLCSVAFVADGKIIGESCQEMTRGHAETILPMILGLAKGLSIKIADAEIIGVTVGPGSYTGIRTGLATARGLSLGSGTPAVGVSSIAAVVCAARRQIEEPLPILCVLETRREDYFGEIYDKAGSSLLPPSVMNVTELRNLIDKYNPILSGNAVKRLLADLPIEYMGCCRVIGRGTPRPLEIAVVAEHIIRGGGSENTLSPLYLREAQARPPKSGNAA